MNEYYVYILANRKNGTLYTGVTNDLPRRVFEHKTGAFAGYTRKYGVKMLVYFEATNDVLSAIKREKELKKWNRAWKIRIIEEKNPTWEDFYERIVK